MLVPIAADLWAIDHLLSLPGRVRMPLRMTVARLGDGGLWVHSPVPVDDATAGELAALGPVRVVVAPNTQHHLFVGPLLARFPQARLLGVAALLRKRHDLPFAGALQDPTVPAPPEIDQTTIDGAPRMEEVVFFHRPSRSLLVTDLLFNILTPQTRMTSLVLHLGGTHRRLAMSRLWRLLRRDRAAFAASLERVLAWAFTRIVPAHGDIVSAGDAARQARAAFAWALR
jgi:hypothetical protein